VTRRLLISYLSLTLLVLLALAVPLGIIYSRGEADRFLADMERDAVVLAEQAEEAIEEGDTDEVPEMLSEYARDTGGRALVVNPKGVVLARSDKAATGANLAASPDIAAALRKQPTAGQRPIDGGDELYVTVPAMSGETIRGVLQITYPTTVISQRTAQVWWILTLVGVLVLLAAAALAVALARWMTRPIRELEQATAQLASGTLDSPPPADLGPPELQRLATTFTNTAGRLQHLIEAQKGFAADASHQLKTPLTALRLRLENLEPMLDPAAHDSLDEAVAETDRLTRMVQGLLALARLEDAGTQPVPIDLEAVIADRATSWAPFAAEHQVSLEVAGQPVGRVQAVPGALEQIIDNLLANALRVAPAGSTLTIDRHHVANGDVEVHVIDQGPGMTPGDRRRALDRFWRAPDATDDGSGLGLAIVAQLVRASGGTITLNAGPDTGIDATVRLTTTAVISPNHRPSSRITDHATPRHRHPRALIRA
jgi:signal transduction histidine kinase